MPVDRANPTTLPNILDKQARIRLYEESYLADSGFEREVIKARQRFAVDQLTQLAPASVVEIGCGTDPLYAKALDLPLAPAKWVIVEPGEAFARIAEEARSPGIPLQIVRGFFEEKVPEVIEACGGSPELTICLGVLQSVRDPGGWLENVRGALEPGDRLVLAVANALSLHRRLAKAMGLIADERELSERDRAGFHYNVFDTEALRSLVDRAGFAVEGTGGYFVKPFTHQQMESMPAVLTPAVMDGLWELGQTMPELASEIFVVAKAT